MADIRIPELDTAFVFKSRPASLPSDLRPLWRVGVILLLLRKCCRSNRSSFGRLHVLNWGVLSKENRLTLQALIRNQATADQVLVRIEPSLNRAVALAAGEGLIERPDGDHLQLTDRGIKLADEIGRSEDLYAVEKELIASIGKQVSEKLVKQIFSAGGKV